MKVDSPGLMDRDSADWGDTTWPLDPENKLKIHQESNEIWSTSLLILIKIPFPLLWFLQWFIFTHQNFAMEGKSWAKRKQPLCHHYITVASLQSTGPCFFQNVSHSLCFHDHLTHWMEKVSSNTQTERKWPSKSPPLELFPVCHILCVLTWDPKNEQPQDLSREPNCEKLNGRVVLSETRSELTFLSDSNIDSFLGTRSNTWVGMKPTSCCENLLREEKPLLWAMWVCCLLSTETK